MNDHKIDFRKPITTGKIVSPYIKKSYERKDNIEKFGNILEQAIGEKQPVKFSKHARERIQTRNIDLSEGDVDKIYRAFDLAEQKGVRDSLVIIDDLALIVNIPSKTVITAMEGSSIKENVFTNIDGAVIV